MAVSVRRTGTHPQRTRTREVGLPALRGVHDMNDLDLVVPGESIEARLLALVDDHRGRTAAHLHTADGERRLALTSVLADRARRLVPGAYVRVVYEGEAMTAAGRPYRKHRIEELLDPPDWPDPAPTRPPVRGQQSLW